jgi:hypothetical protein
MHRTTVWIGDTECAAHVHYYVDVLDPHDCGNGAIPGTKEITIDKILVYPPKEIEDKLIEEIVDD